MNQYVISLREKASVLKKKYMEFLEGAFEKLVKSDIMRKSNKKSK